MNKLSKNWTPKYTNVFLGKLHLLAVKNRGWRHSPNFSIQESPEKSKLQLQGSGVGTSSIARLSGIIVIINSDFPRGSLKAYLVFRNTILNSVCNQHSFRMDAKVLLFLCAFFANTLSRIEATPVEIPKESIQIIPLSDDDNTDACGNDWTNIPAYEEEGGPPCSQYTECYTEVVICLLLTNGRNCFENTKCKECHY